MGAMLGHWDPHKFPSLEELLGDTERAAEVVRDEVEEPRANAAAWIAVLGSMNRKAGATPAMNEEAEEDDDG